MNFNVSGALLRFTDYRHDIGVEAPTLRTALDKLVVRYPDLQAALFDRQGKLRATHRLWLNGEPLQEVILGTPLGNDDQVDILTAVSGG